MPKNGDKEISKVSCVDSESPNLNHNDNSVMGISSENIRLRERVHFDDIHGDIGNKDVYTWDNSRDISSAQHGTTSIHRNIDMKRTVPRNMEQRRKWVSQAATLNRQPLLEHAQKILEYMQQDSLLMSNDPDGELLRREALRNMPQSLAVKKLIKRKFMNSVSSNSKTLGCTKMLKYQISIWFSSIKTNIRNLSYSFELWYSSLKEIEGNFGSGVSTYFKFLRRLFILNLFMMILTMSFVVVPQIIFSLDQHGDNVTIIENNVSFSAADLFTGMGYLVNTTLYYGFYTTGRINSTYSMPNAYFYTMVCLFISNTVVLGISMAKLYRKNFIETMGGLQNVFAHKIFCGWDYGIAKSEAANLRSSAIYTELKELLSDYMKFSEKTSCMESFFVRLLQITGHMFVFGLVGATGFLMWVLLDRHRLDDRDAGVVTVLTPIIINATMVVFPMLFRLIASYEGYKSPRVVIMVTFLRTLLLEVTVVGILVVFWLSHSANQTCWENSLGQEIYRLILSDFVFSVVFTCLVDVARYFMHKKWLHIKSPEFDISGNTFSVIYNQTLFWIGLYFAPMLGIMIVVKLFLTWYVRSWILLEYCVPPKKSWRAAQTETLFLIITFLSSLLVLFVHGYAVLNIPTSDSCGPFKFVEYTHLIFLNAVAEMDTSNNFLMLLNFISKPGVIALVLITMSMVAYYLRSKSIAQRDFVAFLRRRLVLAAQDKEFLLKHISQVTDGAWHHKDHAKREGAINPVKLLPSMPKEERLGDYGDMLPDITSSDDLLVTSTTSMSFSDNSLTSEIIPL